jgi:hypothetical protein
MIHSRKFSSAEIEQLAAYGEDARIQSFERQGEWYDYVGGPSKSFPGDYFYKIAIVAEDLDAQAVITAKGVSLIYSDGSVRRTDITPEDLFTENRALSDPQLAFILDAANERPAEEVVFTPEEMAKLYQIWKKTTQN